MRFKHGTRRRALEYEKDWVQRWKADKTFEKSVENRSKDDAYVFYDGPPFITGVPHHGTLLSSIVKDAVPRYWTMKGKRVERVWGWDCHGLPAENFVEKQLNITDRRQIITPVKTLKAKSFLMGVGVVDDELNELGIYFEKTESGNYKLLIDHGDLERYESFVRAYMKPGFWNEYISNDKTIFIFKDKNGEVSRYIKDDTNQQHILRLCNEYADMEFDSIETMLRGNEWYSDCFASAPLDKDGNELPTISLEQYITKARESMVANSATWEGVIDRIGRWVDFKGAYKTMDKDFMESVWWAFNELYEKGKIYEGEKVLMYDTKFATPVSKAEVTMDNDAYQTVTDPSVYVKFKLKESRQKKRAIIIHGTGSSPDSNWFPYIKKELESLGVEVHVPKFPIGDEQNLDSWRRAFIEQIQFEPDENTVIIGHSVGSTFLLNLLNQKMISPIKSAIFVSGFYDKLNLPHLETQLETFVDLDYDWSLVQKNAGEIIQIHGDDDPAVPLEQAERLAEKLSSELLVVKNGGHLNRKTGYVDKFPELVKELKRIFTNDLNESIEQPRYILAWTTTPWTLPANLMLAVNPEMTYCEVLVDGEKLIIAEEALERVLQDEKHQPLEYKLVRKFPGSELVGKSYASLDTGSTWPENSAIHKVYAADFVSHESGSGIVHIAPAYGEDDFELAKSHGVGAFHVIDDNGYYTDTNYKGLEVWDNNKFIAKDLKEKGIVWKIEYIRHEYPFNPRSKQRIMYRAIPSWFFDIQGSKPLMLEQNENINWFPEHLKHGRFAKNIEQAPDWNLSRDRFWATAMPVWKGIDAQGRTLSKVVGSYEELEELSGVKLDDYHRPWVDDVKFTIDGVEYTRIDKVLDCWFESGSMPFAQLHYPFENKEKFETNYPADFIVEYVGQVRAWFYYVHAVNTALFGDHAFNNVITTGVVAGNDGRKVSKSLGNFTDPNELMDKFSADSLRFLLLSSPLLNGEDFSVQDKDVGDVARKLSMVWNMYDFFTMYAEVDGWEYDGTLTDPLETLTNPLDIWIVSRLHELVAEVEKHMDGYNIPDALSPILPFLDDASNWYVRRSRRRFWKSEDDSDKNDAYKTLHYVLVRLAYILAPFTPFLAEELYHNLTGDEESIHLKDWLPAGEIDDLTVQSMELTRKIVNEGLSARAKAGIKVRQPLGGATVVQAPDFFNDLPIDTFKYYESIITEELNIKELGINYEHMNKDKPEQPEFEVMMNTEITPELKREGLMREVVRLVQNARKNAGLNVDDRIVLNLTTDDGELGQAIEEHKDVIAAETLTEQWLVNDGHSETANVDGMKLTISLQKH